MPNKPRPEGIEAIGRLSASATRRLAKRSTALSWRYNRVLAASIPSRPLSPYLLRWRRLRGREPAKNRVRCSPSALCAVARKVRDTGSFTPLRVRCVRARTAPGRNRRTISNDSRACDARVARRGRQHSAARSQGAHVSKMAARHLAVNHRSPETSSVGGGTKTASAPSCYKHEFYAAQRGAPAGLPKAQRAAPLPPAQPARCRRALRNCHDTPPMGES